MKYIIYWVILSLLYVYYRSTIIQIPALCNVDDSKACVGWRFKSCEYRTIYSYDSIDNMIDCVICADGNAYHNNIGCHSFGSFVVGFLYIVGTGWLIGSYIEQLTSAVKQD